MCTELVQHFGGSYELPCDNIVGVCHACSGDIYAHELAKEGCECSLGAKIHKGCKIPCAACAHEGCQSCMVRDDEYGEYLCGEDCKIVFRLRIERESLEYQLKKLDEYRDRVAGILAKQIGEINRQLKEYE